MPSHSDPSIMDRINESAALLAKYHALEMDLIQKLHGLFGAGGLPSLPKSTVVDIETVVVKAPGSYDPNEFINGAWSSVPSAWISANTDLAAKVSSDLSASANGFVAQLKGFPSGDPDGSATSFYSKQQSPAGFTYAIGAYVGKYGGPDWAPLGDFLGGGILFQIWPSEKGVGSVSGGITVPPNPAAAISAQPPHWRWH